MGFTYGKAWGKIYREASLHWSQGVWMGSGFYANYLIVGGHNFYLTLKEQA
jgi:hypothetical protein